MSDEQRAKPRRLRRRTKVLLGIAGVVVAVVVALLLVPAPKAPLVDITSVDDLKSRFNEDGGKPRVILLVSPT
jgi:hypothetical protein